MLGQRGAGLAERDRQHRVAGGYPCEQPLLLLVAAAPGDREHRTGEGLQHRSLHRVTSLLVEQHADLEQAETVATVLLRDGVAQQPRLGELGPHRLPGGRPFPGVTPQGIPRDAADGVLGLAGREVHRVSSAGQRETVTCSSLPLASVPATPCTGGAMLTLLSGSSPRCLRNAVHIPDVAIPEGYDLELPGRGTTYVTDVPGPPGAPTVLLLHAVGCTGMLTWFPAVEALSSATGWWSSTSAGTDAASRATGSRSTTVPTTWLQ